MNNKIIILFILMVVLISAINCDGQVRKRNTSTKKKTKEKTEQVSLVEKLNAEIKFGNLGFFNGLNLSSKLNVGYKLSNRFTVGGGGKIFYDQFSVIGPDPSITDLGGFLLGRGKITESIYLQAEYSFMNYAKDPDLFILRGLPLNQKINFPLIGAGYASGLGKWKFGIELLYIANSRAQDIQGSVVEYWFGASYNF